MLKLIKNAALLVVGTVSLALGIVGIILSLIPGIPFLILATFCFIALFESISQEKLASKTVYSL